MKKWILIIICSLALIKQANACGFYPYGEDVRFSLLKPNYVPVYGFGKFHYSDFAYGEYANPFSESEYAFYDENIRSWYDYFEGKFTHQEIYDAIFKADIRGLKGNSSFEKALLSESYKTEYEYFKFAQKIAYLNSLSEDPWERKVSKSKIARKKQIKIALKRAKSCKNKDLAIRYAHLAIRLAFYNNDKSETKKIFTEYFEKLEKKSAVYYWALHFHSSLMEESPRRYVEMAKVFMNSHEKRFAADLQFYPEFTKQEILYSCLNEEEKQAVEFYYLSNKLDGSFADIKDFAGKNKDENLLLFLILRETNKLEDWILTPHYSEFSPSLRNNSWEDSVYLATRNRVEDDRLLAGELAQWLPSLHFKDERKAQWLKSITVYLHFLAGEKSLYRNSYQHLKSNFLDINLNRFNKMLYSLMELNASENPNLKSEFVQKTIMQEIGVSNFRFLFAIGRELEYKGNATDAAYLYSHINSVSDNWEHTVYWRSKSLHRTIYNSDFYTDYFFYLDAQYTVNQVEDLLADLKTTDENSLFDTWKRSVLVKEFPRIQDALGTKYLRENKLPKALQAFNLVNDTLWNTYPFKEYLDANPFYTDFYTEHRKSIGDTIRYTKPQIIEKLIHDLSKIDQTQGKQRAYYCFQVANCYLNMTQYGNSWIMKRYYWSSSAMRQRLSDDDEYFQCNLAQKYYLMAEESTNNAQISALALRMAARCENYKMIDIDSQNYTYEDNYYEHLHQRNKFFQKLKERFPDQYEPLVSNCHSFVEYNKILQN